MHGLLSEIINSAPFRRIAHWTWSRAFLWTGLALLVWYYASQAVHDLLVWGALALALPRFRRAQPLWCSVTGIAFVGILVFSILTLPLSDGPAESARDLIRWARLPAGAFAISVWFNRPDRLFGAIWYSALAITLVLAADLGRLIWCLRGEVLAQAHAYEPFMLNHSNVSSLLAGGCFLVFAAAPALAGGLASARPPVPAVKRVYRIVSFGGMFLCGAYLVILASRGPQIAFLATLSAAGLVWIPNRYGRLAWVVGVVMALGFLWTQREIINPRFRNRAEVADFAGRTAVWQHTWDLAQQRPWRGYGFGKRVFQRVYRGTNPPASPFEYPHPHSYALFVLFQHGWPGILLYGLAWGLLAARLVVTLWQRHNRPDRWLPGLVGLLLLLHHLYGLGDYPDNRLAIMLVWLVPAALMATTFRPDSAGV